MGFVIFLHVFVCIFLSLVILMQSGRGGGLTEQFASAESLFGAKTNIFMVKATSVMATVFFITCIALAILSTRQQQSLRTATSSAPKDSPHPTTATPATPGPSSDETAEPKTDSQAVPGDSNSQPVEAGDAQNPQ